MTAKNIWDNSTFDFIGWMHYSQGTTPEGDNYVFVKIIEELFDYVEYSELPPINMYFVPNPLVNGLFNLDSVKSVITDIYFKNGIDNVSFSLADKNPLSVHDLWLTLIEDYSLWSGNTHVDYHVPMTIKWPGSFYQGCWVNFAKIKFQTTESESFFNYRIGYVASHEYLHQLLIKAFWYIYSADGSECVLDRNHFHNLSHNNDEDNLNCDGSKLKNPLPKKKTQLLPPVEKILPQQRRFIVNYLILRKFDIDFTSNVRKVFFPIVAKEIKKKLLIDFE
ncbi:MAG: hypothetical protein IPH04_01650 [Saprospirales bacterium]|nr:hypothetical protein [Saprospirales bacterium]